MVFYARPMGPSLYVHSTYFFFKERTDVGFDADFDDSSYSSLYPQLPVHASFGQCDFRPAITAESFRPVVAQTEILKLLFIRSPFIRAPREFNYASHAAPVNWRITGAVVGGNWNQRGNYAQSRTSRTWAPPQ